MQIQTIDNFSIAVYMEKSDLDRMHLAPDSITEKDTALLLGRIFKNSNEKPGKNIQLELYPGRDDVLLFIRLSGAQPSFFAFSSFEELLSAISGADPSPSALYYIGGRYILSISPWHGEKLPLSLWEFGTNIQVPPSMTLHYEEHGKTIIKTDAVGTLQKLFISARS